MAAVMIAESFPSCYAALSSPVGLLSDDATSASCTARQLRRALLVFTHHILDSLDATDVNGRRCGPMVTGPANSF